MGLADTAELAVRINLSGNASAGIDKLTRKVNGLGGSVGRVGKGVGQMGAGIAKAGLVVGAAVVTGLGAAAKAAIDFEDAFAGVRKTVDEADLAKAGLSFQGLSDSFRKMATEIPITAVEFARIGEAAGALGVKVTDIETFTKTVSMLGVTTDLTADSAADALGRIGTILGFTGKDYENFANSLVALGNAGASVESEIAEIVKRFAAEGKAAGLATADIAGLASATASLGFAPERGGTALSRVFANMGTNISLANDKGKAFSKLTGRSIKDLQSSLDKGKGLGIFLDVLESIKGLSPTQANRTLKALGINNTSDRTIFRTMADQLPFVNEQLDIAKDATGALLEEATKKFATTASKIQLLKNNLIEAGITLGEQFLPSVRNAIDKIIGVLKLPGTKSDIKALGQDIAKAIDGIEWDKLVKGARDFVGVMKTAAGIFLDILGAVNKLPTEIKATAGALLLLNKASGGLIASGLGNIIGGVVETAIRGLGSQLPGVGKLFAQPVFVTNWPLGGLGGGGPLGAAGGKLSGLDKAFNLLGKAILVGFVAEAAIQLNPILNQFGKDLGAQLGRPAVFAEFGANWEEWRKNAPWPLGQKGAPEFLGGKPEPGGAGGGFGPPLPRLGPPTPPGPQLGPPTPVSVPHRHDVDGRRIAEFTPPKTGVIPNVLDNLSPATSQKLAEVTAAARETTRETTRGATLTAATARTGSAAIVGAIYANRPDIDVVVNVSGTTVSKTIVKKERYGPSLGSRNRNLLGKVGALI